MNAAVKEPLFHVVKRDRSGWARGVLVRVAAIVLALIVSAVVIVASLKKALTLCLSVALLPILLWAAAPPKEA